MKAYGLVKANAGSAGVDKAGVRHKGLFDNISHKLLMKAVRKHVHPVPLQHLHHYYEPIRASVVLRYSRLAVFAA